MTSKGQVTVPAGQRVQHGLLPNCEVEWISTKDGLLLRKAKKQTRGDALLESLQEGGKWPGRSDKLLAQTRGDS